MKAYDEDGVLFLVPETDLVASKIEELRDFFLEQLNAHPEVDKIVFNAGGIDIVDSLGVNLIIGLYRQATSEEKDFKVINAGSNFMKIANFFRFPSIFSIEGGEK